MWVKFDELHFMAYHSGEEPSILPTKAATTKVIRRVVKVEKEVEKETIKHRSAQSLACFGPFYIQWSALLLFQDTQIDRSSSSFCFFHFPRPLFGLLIAPWPTIPPSSGLNIKQRQLTQTPPPPGALFITDKLTFTVRSLFNCVSPNNSQPSSWAKTAIQQLELR